MYRIKNKVELCEILDTETGKEMIIVEVRSRDRAKISSKTFYKDLDYGYKFFSEPISNFIKEECDKVWC